MTIDITTQLAEIARAADNLARVCRDAICVASPEQVQHPLDVGDKYSAPHGVATPEEYDGAWRVLREGRMYRIDIHRLGVDGKVPTTRPPMSAIAVASTRDVLIIIPTPSTSMDISGVVRRRSLAQGRFVLVGAEEVKIVPMALVIQAQIGGALRSWEEGLARQSPRGIH